MIISSAIKLADGRVFVGKRHGDCFLQCKTLVGTKSSTLNHVQGFINDRLQFLNREDAYYEAVHDKQCEPKQYNGKVYAKGLEVDEATWVPLLMSEDLW